MTISAILDKALAGRELTVEEGELLFSAQGSELQDLVAAADEVRRSRVGDRVTYVVNRNINFTNVCRQAVRVLRLQPRASGRGGLFPANRRSCPAAPGRPGILVQAKYASKPACLRK